MHCMLLRHRAKRFNAPLHINLPVIFMLLELMRVRDGETHPSPPSLEAEMREEAASRAGLRSPCTQPGCMKSFQFAGSEPKASPP